MKNKKKKITSIIILGLIVVSAVFIYYSKQKSVKTQEPFICPEDYKTETDQVNAIADFIGAYEKANPNTTVEQILAARYESLVSHSCNQTLENMLQHVSSTTPILRFIEKDFRFEWTSFDESHKVWEIYYPLSGQSSQSFDEELYFNLYPDNLWKKGVVTAKDVADDYIKRADTYIIHSFEAPDPITGGDSYYILSEALFPSETYTNAYITKISAVKGGAYMVSYVKKIIGPESNIEDLVNKWLIKDTSLKNGASMEIGNIGVDPLWMSYLSTQKQN